MEQRLINAYALKEKLNELGWTAENGFDKRIYLDDIIDNVPTVNLEKISFMKGYNYGCDDGKRFYERPKGEWVKLYHENPYACDDYGRSYVECSVCGQTHGTDDSDFCPNCGADMRGSEEK